MVPPSFQEIGLMDLLAFDINAIFADKYSLWLLIIPYAP